MGNLFEPRGLVVAKATDESEMREVFRLRYDVYIDEQRKPVPWVDHRARLYADSSDKFARVQFIVRNPKGELVAAARAHTEPSPTVRRYLRWNVFESEGRGPLYVTSKFVVRADYRHSAAAKLLIAALTEDYFSINAEFSLLHCSPRFVKLYERMGFRAYAPEFNDPFVGRQCPMGAPTGADLSGARHGGVFGNPSALPAGSGAKEWFETAIRAGAFIAEPVVVTEQNVAGVAAQ